MKNKLVHWFIISTFVSLYLIVSVISTIHVIEFFELSNPKWLAVSLALAFEVGAAASLSSLIIMEKMNKFMVWSLFIILTVMQAMGNTYYAYTHLDNFQSWIELFGLVDEDLIYQKRMLSIISGAILPLVSLGFIKSLVDYIKPNKTVDTLPEQDVKTETEQLPLGTEGINEIPSDAALSESIEILEAINADESGIENADELAVPQESEPGSKSIQEQATAESHMVNVNSNRPVGQDPISDYRRRLNG
jgi:hypothetical protein